MSSDESLIYDLHVIEKIIHRELLKNMKIYGFDMTTIFSRFLLLLVCVGIIALIITIPVNALFGYAAIAHNKQIYITVVKVIIIMLAALAIIWLIRSLIKNNYKKKDNNSAQKLKNIEKQINNFKPNFKYKYDKPGLVAVREALKAAKEGNFGIGACIYNEKTEKIVAHGHNKMFSPYFRSDMHAEMNTLDKFEKKMKFHYPPKVNNLILFSSLEPCPMCLTRIINSGIPKVEYLAPDLQGGMVPLLKNLPPIWQEIAKNRVYEQAKCSPKLIKIANKLYLFSANKLNTELIKN